MNDDHNKGPFDEARARILTKQISSRFGGRYERFLAGVSAFGALYRVKARLGGMNLHLHVGDEVQTIWVQNFQVPAELAPLSLSINEPDRAAALVKWLPSQKVNCAVFIDSFDENPGLAERFCVANSAEIAALELQLGERLSVQTRQMRLRLLTTNVDRIEATLSLLGQIFARYVKTGANAK